MNTTCKDNSFQMYANVGEGLSQEMVECGFNQVHKAVRGRFLFCNGVVIQEDERRTDMSF